MPIQVLLYEDNTVLRDALSFLIQSTEGFGLVGAFGECTQAVTQVVRLDPDVVLMDIDMPQMDGIEALTNIKKRCSFVDVLMLTVFDDDERLFECIRAGATGYLLKKTPPGRILDAIKEVYEGGAPMSPSIARRVMQSLQQRPSSNSELAQLTDREQQVLNLLADGLSYKMIANECKIGIETVRTHIKRIYEKLHVHSVTEAIAKLHKR